MKRNHVCVCLGVVDESQGIPCDACREDKFWREYLEAEAVAQERERAS